MCGIAGIITTDPWSDSLTAALTRMQAALRHRGPDDQGLWVDPAAGVGLVHTRLAILDLSPAGHQPMASADGRYQIVFNGEIYNFRELRASLEQEGVSFQTETDTEVLLRLYERHQEKMVDLLRGMFAICIWDQLDQTAFLARDALGIKPLYIHAVAGTLAFSSELKALTTSGVFTPSANLTAIQRYFKSGTVPEPLTLINEAILLEAGHSLTWKAGASTSRRFWQITFAVGAEGDAVALTRGALLDSVRHHFVSDLPVGIFLSGGIDSTAILALANELGHRGINSFSIAVDDQATGEGPTARRTAAHFDSHHQELKLDAKVACGLFDQFLKHLDQPTIDGFNTFTVASLARHHGMKVVLSGLGGDELFGGYASFTKIPKMLRLHPVLSKLPGLAALLQCGKPPHRRMADFLRSPGTVEDAYTALRGIFSQSEAAALTQWLTGRPCEVSEAIPAQPTRRNDINEGDLVSELEITCYMRNQLLRDSDVMSMAHGLELRVPLVDRVLTEQVCAIHASKRLSGHKSLLTSAVPEIPEWVVNQKKRGFLFPYQNWLGSEWGSALASASAGAPVTLPNWYQKWSVFVLRHTLRQLGLSL